MEERNLIKAILEKARISLALAGKPVNVKFSSINAGNGDGAVLFGNVKKNVELKRALPKPQLLSVIRQCQAHDSMLFTEYLTEAAARELAECGIEFADAAGNLFLKLPEHTFLIMNCKKANDINRERNSGRIFAPSGLKLIYILLTAPEMLKANYRILQAKSGVSLGSAGYIMADLKEHGLLLEIDGELRFADKEKLAERWCLAYSEKLRGKLNIQRYSAGMDNFKDVQLLAGLPAAWGGEAAAYFLAGHLHPEIWSIYRWGNINKLIARTKLRPDPNGNIEILDAFWPEQGSALTTVHPLLIYADLIASGDSRNLETAMEIHQKYLIEQ
ncbi:MAG: type IV toxin-antitoxin system AbiEi family antitoxin [Lentisphaerota bacterium]